MRALYVSAIVLPLYLIAVKNPNVLIAVAIPTVALIWDVFVIFKKGHISAQQEDA